jgi:hypothetical protein
MPIAPGGGRLEKILECSVHDLTVFKLHFGKLTLKMYDKGERVLRIEIIVNNVEELRCGKRLEKLPASWNVWSRWWSGSWPWSSAPTSVLSMDDNWIG